jgi:hypothetical protein
VLHFRFESAQHIAGVQALEQPSSFGALSKFHASRHACLHKDVAWVDLQTLALGVANDDLFLRLQTFAFGCLLDGGNARITP